MPLPVPWGLSIGALSLAQAQAHSLAYTWGCLYRMRQTRCTSCRQPATRGICAVPLNS